MITLCTGDLEECVRGATETAELLLSSVAPLRQRGLELYVIINKATWLHYIHVAEAQPGTLTFGRADFVCGRLSYLPFCHYLVRLRPA